MDVCLMTSALLRQSKNISDCTFPTKMIGLQKNLQNVVTVCQLIKQHVTKQKPVQQSATKNI